MRSLLSIAVAATLHLLAVRAADKPQLPKSPLNFTKTAPGKPIKPGTELRILPVGDSLTYGFLSDEDGGDGNGYRLRLRDDLSKDKVVYAGTESDEQAFMTDGYFAAWVGETIQYIADRVGPSLKQRPNIILLYAGTTDLGLNKGHDPVAASERLGSLIDQMVTACPDAVILVAMIIGTCKPAQEPQTKVFQSLIPGVVNKRLQAGKHVLAVDMTTFPLSDLSNCINPTNAGYQLVGDYWYDFLTQVPQDWITTPVGPDPNRGLLVQPSLPLPSGPEPSQPQPTQPQPTQPPKQKSLGGRLDVNMLLLGTLGLLLVWTHA